MASEPDKLDMTFWGFDAERKALRQGRTVLLCTDIHEDSTRDFVQDFELLGRAKEPITIIIASDGGQVSSGLACIRAIRRAQDKGIKIVGQVHGHAFSMAFFILQCCDERIMGKLCSLMAHGMTAFTVGDSRNLEAERKLLKFWRKELAELLAKRNTAKDSRYASPEYWRKILEDNTPQYYDSDEAFQMGLIDKVE